MAKGKRQDGARPARAGRSPVVLGLAALVVLVLAAAAVWLAGGREGPLAGSGPTGVTASGMPLAPVVARRETRPTLDPARFVGKAAAAHRVAREIPDVLDQLYCYCQCDKHLGHKSLLSCYTDGHAAT